ncbi:hypothetical protein MSPP1_001555 [Malassezia sp. CBS 17886]|nr:hypothetical protein MSPP1_001555 [Malassezia sp. CBS 17886]
MLWIVSFNPAMRTFPRAPRAAPTAHGDALLKCRWKDARVGPPPAFAARRENDRYLPGTPPLFICNATVWTGDSVLREASVLVEHGLIKRVGPDMPSPRMDAHVVNAHGRWLTPGIVDMHTHLGVSPMPDLPSTLDVNSKLGATQPMLRSIDGFNEHDQALRVTLAGGVTTALVLPGSLDNIGGQAYAIKLGDLQGRMPSSRIVDPPRALVLPGEGRHGRDDWYTRETGMRRPDGSTAFRQIKMACGENARSYNLMRFDEAWNFRHAFDHARTLRQKQDAFCARLDEGVDQGEYPDDLALEALVDVLRGKAKVQTHCYTMNDLDAFVRHATEFRFPVAAFHHAHEAYLVPSLLHASFEHPPAVALFSTNANYKYESYFGSPFAAVLLRAANITPVFKSDHPVLDSRRLVHQAAQAHHFGLAADDALRAVTSAPAAVVGLDHRIGFVREGHDADLVLWDRHPLVLGATPTHVIVDGRVEVRAPREEDARAASTEDGETEGGLGGGKRSPLSSLSSASFCRTPRDALSANYTSDIEHVQSHTAGIIAGRVHAFPTPVRTSDAVVLHNISAVYARAGESGVRTVTATHFPGRNGTLVYAHGHVLCTGVACGPEAPPGAPHVDLHGGVVTPGVLAYGSTLGLADIPSEASASDGWDPASLTRHLKLDTERATTHAADGLFWGGNDLRRAHAQGVTAAVVAPAVKGEFGGLSAHFDTGVQTVLNAGSVRTESAALHVTLEHRGALGPSLATQVAVLREALTWPPTDEWALVANGTLPLVVRSESIAVAAHVVRLKSVRPQVRVIVDSAAPLHRLAQELAANDISILLPPRVWAFDWDSQGRFPGPPLSQRTELGALLRHGIRVGFRVSEAWEAANLFWEAAAAAREAGVCSPEDILSFVTTNIEDMLALNDAPGADFVAFDNDPFHYGAKVVAIGTLRSAELFA